MFCNIAAYKFVNIDENLLPIFCKKIKSVGIKAQIKGTVLLSTEGINLFLAGEEENIKSFQAYLNEYDCFQDLSYKYSYSTFIPFKKLFVKIRKEIVTFKRDEINPEKFTAPYITPEKFQTWYNTNRDMLILDTRNKFEFELGTFENAWHLNIDNFREFPEAIKELPSSYKEKTIVTFCTGGIRCEKAAAYLLLNGFSDVYQLQGGILNYFQQCGDKYFNGDCFVFDDRLALNSKLESTAQNNES